MQTESILTNYISQELAIGRAKAISPDDDLVASGILDSLGLMQLVLFIEEKLRIHVPDEDVLIENFRTVRILSAYLDQRRVAPSSG